MEFLGPNASYYAHVLALGALAGLTIFLGIPLAFYRGSLRARAFLSSLSVGVLLFLFVEISYQLIEGVESHVQLAAADIDTGEPLWWQILILVCGFSAGLVGLLAFETRFLRHGAPRGMAPVDRRRLTLLIALGIGLHNFSEGLIIGQAFITGSLLFGYTLVAGFALHNATEGFGIVAPVVGTSPGASFLLTAGLLGGGPTMVGTLLGASYTSATLEALFSALAAGAIIYIVAELLEVGRHQAGRLTVGAGILAGFFLAFGSDLVIQVAMTPELAAAHAAREIEIEAGDYYFKPRSVELEPGELTTLVLKNRGSVDHEIEIVGLGRRTERRIPVGREVRLTVNARRSGRAIMLCDMPGHLSGGMWGMLTVREPGTRAAE